MKNFARFPALTMLLALLLAPLAWSGQTLFSSVYSGNLSGFKVKTTRSLVLNGDGSYRFSSIAKHSLGSITELSDFRLENDRIVPLKYHYKRSIIGFKRQEWIDFDWSKKQATYRRKGKSAHTTVHKLVDGMLDPSLYQLQLQRDVFRLQSDIKAGDLDYTFVKHRRIKQMPFRKLADEIVELNDVKYKAVKVERINTQDDKQTFVWLIPELNYQIGKIVHIDEDGDAYELKIGQYLADKAIFDAIYVREQ